MTEVVHVIQSIRCEGLHLKTKKHQFEIILMRFPTPTRKVSHAIASRKKTMNECFDIESSFTKAQNKAHFPTILDT